MLGDMVSLKNEWKVLGKCSWACMPFCECAILAVSDLGNVNTRGIALVVERPHLISQQELKLKGYCGPVNHQCTLCGIRYYQCIFSSHLTSMLRITVRLVVTQVTLSLVRHG